MDYISKIKINRVRHLKNIEIPLSDNGCRHLIITGKNGSGKTSLLEALRLSLWLNHDDPSTTSWIADKLSDNLTFDPLKYQFEINKIIPKTGLIFNHLDKKHTLTLSKDLSGVEIIFQSTDLTKCSLDPKDYILAYYPAERTYLIQNEKVGKVSFQDSYKIYEHPGKDFVKYLKELYSQEALFRNAGNIERADKIHSWIKNFILTLRKIYDNDKINIRLDIEQMKFFIEEPNKNPFSFDELASGYAAILDIITDLMMRMEKKVGNTYDMPGFVLIDEVDAHLHLSLQKNILPTLTSLFPNVQFIVTTHSPFVLSSVSDAVVYNLETNTLVNTDEGLSLLPYSGIVEGYFGVSELSRKLKEKFERYKALSKKDYFTDDDYNELGDLESYLDEIPDFLALDIMADYRQIKLELEQRAEVTENNG
jgi:AAA15 family ATPase/GTPase